MHDGGLSRVVVELLPDELGHEGLDEQAAAQHGQVVSSEQQRDQQHQAAVNLPQSPALELGVGRDDLRSQQVLAAREEDAQNKDVNKTSLHGSPARQREREKERSQEVLPGLILLDKEGKKTPLFNIQGTVESDFDHTVSLVLSVRAFQ